MVPAEIVLVERPPLTAAGTVDLRALEQIRRSRRRAAASGTTRPLSDVEALVASQIFAPLLGRTDLDPDDNFFSLGGTSLGVLATLARVRALLGVEVRVASFFSAPTVAGLAAAVEAERTALILQHGDRDALLAALEQVEESGG